MVKRRRKTNIQVLSKALENVVKLEEKDNNIAGSGIKNVKDVKTIKKVKIKKADDKVKLINTRILLTK